MLSRLKFDIKPLVNEMLDRLPADVWTRTDTTFLDPAMAGGQFIVEICNRLLKAGHSWDNIESRVFGLADSPLSLNFAKNKYKIRGQFSVGSIEMMEQWVTMGKKFDVVIGNPPYQATDRNGDRTSKKDNLWSRFVTKAQDLVTDNGFVTMIHPSSWMSPATGKVGGSLLESFFKKYQTSYIKLVNGNDVFGVGTGWCSVYAVKKARAKAGHVVKMVGQDGKDFQVSLDSLSFIPVLVTADAFGVVDKFFGTTDKMTFKHSTELNTFNKTSLAHLSKTKTAKNKYPVFHTNAQTLWSDVQHSNHGRLKVMVSLSGYIKPVLSDNSGTTHIGFWHDVNSTAEGVVLCNVLESKVYQFIFQTCKWSGFNSKKVLEALPAVDLTRSWSDAELYAHFNLTQEEIDLIEATVK